MNEVRTRRLGTSRLAMMARMMIIAGAGSRGSDFIELRAPDLRNADLDGIERHSIVSGSQTYSSPRWPAPVREITKQDNERIAAAEAKRARKAEKRRMA
jgi:hypothetical protein